MIHIYTAVSCEGAIMLCAHLCGSFTINEPFKSGHSQLAYLYNYARDNYDAFDYCPKCVSEVPQAQKDLSLLTTTEL